MSPPSANQPYDGGFAADAPRRLDSTAEVAGGGGTSKGSGRFVGIPENALGGKTTFWERTLIMINNINNNNIRLMYFGPRNQRASPPGGTPHPSRFGLQYRCSFRDPIRAMKYTQTDEN